MATESVISAENGYYENRIKKLSSRRRVSNAITALICTVAVGVGFTGYLYYMSYYSQGWHTHKEGTYYILKETGERATGYQIIENTCYLFDDDGLILPSGWHEFRGDKYYVGSDGVIQRGVVTIDGEEY